MTFSGALANIIITIIALIVFLCHLGIEPSALVTTQGIGTLAIALAAKATLSNTIAGFTILLISPSRSVTGSSCWRSILGVM